MLETVLFGRAVRASSFLILVAALTASMPAQVAITSGTAGTTYGLSAGPNDIEGSLGLEGQNLSVTGSGLTASGCASATPTGRQGNNVASVVFNPTCTNSVSGNPIALGTVLQVVYNGTTYTYGAAYYIAVSMNFSGPSVTAPNATEDDPAGNYTASASNVPFSMTGSITVYSGSAGGPVVVSISISGSGLYSASQAGNILASGPGGIPSGNSTYQFKTASSTMFGLDTSTEGAWIGKYGADGYLIANGPNRYPSYASVTLAGETPFTWAGQSTDPRALTLPGSSSGIAAAYTTQYSNQTFSINIDFTDGKTHRVALYALDWDTESRVETVTITNVSTNTVLDSEVLSNFHNGEYGTWDLTGNVLITVTPNPGQTPVISGIFFDPVTTTTPSPSFTLSATAASAAAGSSGASTVTVSPLNGFTSSVSLAATAWPAGITGTFTPSSTATTSNVNISVASSVTPGNYSLTVTGTSGSLSATATIALTVTAAAAPSFTISATAVTTAAESFGYSTVTVTDMNGFVSPVTISTPGWPTGITGSVGVNPVVSTGSVAIDVDGGVAPGTYSLPVTATSGTLSASTTIKLTVTAGSPIFTISAAPVTIAAGSSGSSKVTATFTGSPEPVTLATSGLPTGITATTTSITPPASTGSVTISVASSVTPGVYLLTLVGTESPVSYLTTISLTVTAAAAPSFTISATAVTTPAESFGYSTVTVTDMNGFISPVSISTPGWPTGITGSVGVNPVVSTGTVAIDVDGGVAPGIYSLPVTATSGTLSASTTIKLTVTAGSPVFTISAAPVTIAAGSSGSSKVTATFTGSSEPVTLATSGLPTGITATTTSITPPASTGSVTISVASSVTPGIYSLTLIGTESPVSYLTTIALTVTASSSSGSSAVYTGLDTTTQGAWNGKYGGDGFLIANDVSSSLPSYASSLTVTGASTYTWVQMTTDPRALQAGKGFSSGIASTYYGNTFNINVNLTDGNTHQVGLYILDWDTTSRAEGIVITDAVTNAVLDQESFTAFHNGQWAVWNIKGNVIIKLTTSTTANNAVFSGIFFGPASGTAPAPSFSLGATATSIADGSSGLSTVTVNPLNGFASSVSLAATAWPSGITGTFTPSSTATTSSVDISVGPSVTPGNYSLTVTGTSGSLSATTTIALTVTAAAAPSFTISATAVTTPAESFGYSTVTVTDMNGFISPVSISTPGWPTGITGSVGVNPVVSTGSVAIDVDGGVAPGIYSLPVTATSGTLSASTTIKLTVTAGSPVFTISAAPVTIAAGSSGSSTVTATFTGSSEPVTLATSGLPVGITATTTGITPPASTGSVTISVASSVIPGVYSLTLIGTESPVSYLTTIALTVTGGSSSSGSSAVYTGLDTTTQGAWNGKYGGDGFLIANDVSSSLPSYASSLTVTGASTYTWVPMTTDPRALQAGKGFSSGIASTYYGNTFNINLNLTDGNTHQVAVYILDWDTTSRAEGIVIMDAATNAVLDQESFTAFHNGQWAVWNIKGNVIIKLATSTTANNAVFSGIFFGPAGGTPSSYPLTAGLNVSISELNGSSEVVQADPSSSVVSSSDSVTYLFKWGDGQSSSATVNAPVTHTYATPGTYEVTLDLSDTGGETSSASQSITTQTVPTKNYGEVAFGANTPVAGLVGLTTTLIVPAKPPAVGTLFLWPGIQPNPNSPSYNPIGNGVLQPVLTWGPSCAPTAQPTEYSTWWISGQYVNSTNPAYASDECSSGPAISVNVGDSLLINMTLNGTVWTQTITDMQTAQSTSFNYNLEGQQQGYLYFIIEEDSSAPITPVQFNNTTFTFSNSTGASCFPSTIGVNDSISAPQLKNNGTQCFVPSITLRAQGIN